MKEVTWRYTTMTFSGGMTKRHASSLSTWNTRTEKKNVVHRNKAGYQLGDRYALAAYILKTQDERWNTISSYGSILEGGYDGMVVVQRTTFWYDHVACYNMRNRSLAGLALLGAVFYALVRNSTRWRRGRSTQFRSIVRKDTKWRTDGLLQRL